MNQFEVDFPYKEKLDYENSLEVRTTKESINQDYREQGVRPF